jgi:hypothetical protein
MASDIDASISTFGWSLSAGMDLDQNEYPDLLIGAYESANAVYLRSAPVVHLDSKVRKCQNTQYQFLWFGVKNYWKGVD